MNVIVERIVPRHINSFHHALDCVARERKYLAFLEALPLASTREFVMQNIEKGYAQFVAVAEANVVGWCDVIPKQRPVYSHCGVLGMGLLAPFRGKGHGTALLHATLNEARRQGLARIELAVRADNAPAIRLYDKFGFRQEGVLKAGVRVDGSYKDVIVMAIIDPAVALAGGGSRLSSP
jgi:RimJ/RimL family protein N-acetyltransferase